MMLKWYLIRNCACGKFHTASEALLPAQNPKPYPCVRRACCQRTTGPSCARAFWRAGAGARWAHSASMRTRLPSYARTPPCALGCCRRHTRRPSARPSLPTVRARRARVLCFACSTLFFETLGPQCKGSWLSFIHCELTPFQVPLPSTDGVTRCVRSAASPASRAHQRPAACSASTC